MIGQKCLGPAQRKSAAGGHDKARSESLSSINGFCSKWRTNGL